MKKIKVITLLNKIANGEEAPKKIKYGGQIYLKDKENDVINTAILNNEIEIIEDDEEEPEIDTQQIEELHKGMIIDNGKIEPEMIINLKYKVNELVKAVKQLDRQINGDKTGDK